jgi:hypothetical protein
MVFPVLFLLLAATTRVELVDDLFPIPPRQWRYFEIAITQQPVVVNCAFEVRSGHSAVRVALLSRRDLQRMDAGEPHGFVQATEPGARGSLRHSVRVPGDYAVVIDNPSDGPQPALVHLRVFLDFADHGPPPVRYLPRSRRLAVILISFAVFFAIVIYSGRKLWQAVKG